MPKLRRMGKSVVTMDVYLSGEFHNSDIVSIIENCCNGTGIAMLKSFYYCNKSTEQIIPKLGKFMLDSGAFTLFTSGRHVDWTAYIEKYADFINRNSVELFFELDVDVLIGHENVKKLRKMLEDKTGRKCIPVWHKNRGKEEFLRLCDEYDYVGLGGIVPKEIKPQEYKYFPWFIKEAHRRGAKLHAMGFTRLKELPKYHFDSVDSSTWISGNQYGYVYQFTKGTLIKHMRPEGMWLKNSREAAVHNFKEWVKFQRYAEKYL